MMKSNKIKITTLSPLCIGSGGVMNSITDYIIEGRKFHYLDKQFIATKLAEDDVLMDRYIQGVVYGMDNNRTDFNLKEFLERTLKLSPNDYIQGTIDILELEGKKEIHNIIKDAKNCPYIPGSTLKGAIKTAFLYNWLLNENNSWCSEYLSTFDNQLRKQLNNQLEEQLQNYTLSIHDTDSVDTSDCKIIETKRLHLINGTQSIPQTWEAVMKNSSFITEIWNMKYKNKEKEKAYDWEEFCQIVNQYTKDQNNREWDILENLGNNDSLDDDVYNSLIDFYADMNEEISDNPKTAFLRIGSGKGYFYNSIGLALYKRDNSNKKTKFLDFLKKNNMVRRTHNNAEKFPITRSIEMSNATPLGWIKLELNN